MVAGFNIPQVIDRSFHPLDRQVWLRRSLDGKSCSDDRIRELDQPRTESKTALIERRLCLLIRVLIAAFLRGPEEDQ